MPTNIREATATTVGAAGPGKIKVGLITPGLGSSGYYSQQVLENAATAKVWPKGTHVFFDHPSESELHDRPERSVRDLAAVFDEDAYWDGSGLVAEASVIGPYRELVTDPVFAESVGMSIRASADGRVGEVDGKKCFIITDLLEGQSVDLVTRAGRGGRILSVLESARREIREASVDQTRDRLYDAVRDAHADSANDVYAWVRDFDPEAGRVWFEISGSGDRDGLFEQAYSLDADDMPTLTGDRIEVAVRTEYVPVKPPVNPAGSTTQESTKEDTMPQIEESRLAQLEEAAGRVQSLETEHAAAVQRADTAEAALAVHKAREAARPAVAKAVAESGLPTRRQARIVESVLRDVTAESTPEQVAEATKVLVDDEVADLAEIAESLGVGRPHGFGQPAGEFAGYSVEDFDAAFDARKEG